MVIFSTLLSYVSIMFQFSRIWKSRFRVQIPRFFHFLCSISSPIIIIHDEMSYKSDLLLTLENFSPNRTRHCLSSCQNVVRKIQRCIEKRERLIQCSITTEIRLIRLIPCRNVSVRIDTMLHPFLQSSFHFCGDFLYFIAVLFFAYKNEAVKS